MPISRGLYQILGAQSTDDLRNQLNLLLGEISDRLDKIEGIRGTSTISSNLELSGNANVASDLNLTGDASVGGDQSVSGASSVTGNSSIGGDATVDGRTVEADHPLRITLPDRVSRRWTPRSPARDGRARNEQPANRDRPVWQPFR